MQFGIIICYSAVPIYTETIVSRIIILIEKNIVAHWIGCNPSLRAILDYLGNILKCNLQFFAACGIKILCCKAVQPSCNRHIGYSCIHFSGGKRNRVESRCLIFDGRRYRGNVLIILPFRFISAAPASRNKTGCLRILVNMIRRNTICKHDHIYIFHIADAGIIQKVSGQHQAAFNIGAAIIPFMPSKRKVYFYIIFNGIFHSVFPRSAGCVCPTHDSFSIAAKLHHGNHTLSAVCHIGSIIVNKILCSVFR